MDVTLNNVLEGARQYFMGVPKPVGNESSGQPLWPAGVPPPEEGSPAQSGAPASRSRPPSAAAAPPTSVPPRPPSEPIEPEPHIIHKATVMREALEKRRENPEPEDEETNEALSPPSHIICKPPATLPSPAPAPAAPCPSPARPPSSMADPMLEQNRPTAIRGTTPNTRPMESYVPAAARPPDHYVTGRPPDPYSASRPPEMYQRYPYETNLPDGGRISRGQTTQSPQPALPRHSQSPQTYARMTNSIPNAVRIRDPATHSPPRYPVAPVSQPPPHNDRVPPIHHPVGSAPAPGIGRPTQAYATPPHYRAGPGYARVSPQYERHTAKVQRKYDAQQAYPGYRPAPAPSQPMHPHRIEPLPQSQYSQNLDAGSPYGPRSHDRIGGHVQPPDSARLSGRVEYSNRAVDSRSSYQYPTPSTSTARYPANPAVPVVQNVSAPTRTLYRPAPTSVQVPKATHDYAPTNNNQISPARPTPAKPNFSNQSTRMTVSVTSLVNQMNQTKQKRESPLDLSVKTVKNSADSTAQDDTVDSASNEHKSIVHPRPGSSSRPPMATGPGFATSHKVDFAPDFHSQYRPQPAQRYNGTYENMRPAVEYPSENRHPSFGERIKYVSAPKNETVPRIDLTRPSSDDRRLDNRIQDDRNFIIEERKRPSGPIVSNIPEKMLRYETWTADSRLDRNSIMDRSAREQQELMRRPVYSYNSHKKIEANQHDHRKQATPQNYVDLHQIPHVSNRYPYHLESARHPAENHSHYMDRTHPFHGRHKDIMKNHRDIHAHHHSSIPADKRVLSILRNSLETKQTGFVENPRQAKQISEVIVIDDADADITDLTNDNDIPITKNKILDAPPSPNALGQNIHMPRAVDSIALDIEYQRSGDSTSKTKSPENDVASRIRTKAELKVMPPHQENNCPIPEQKTELNKEQDKGRLQPKSQKQHLFNQIREDSLRLGSVTKNEVNKDTVINEIKSEPMNIEEIERDAQTPIKMESNLDVTSMEEEQEQQPAISDDLDWTSACDSFMEQLKTGSHKKKPKRKRVDTETDTKSDIISSKATNPITEPDQELEPGKETVFVNEQIVVKQEPVDDYEATEHEKNMEPSIVEETNIEKALSKVKKDKVNSKDKIDEKVNKLKTNAKTKEVKSDKRDKAAKIGKNKKDTTESIPIKTTIKEESESTDDDEPLIKSKLLKEKQQSEKLNYLLLKELAEKSAYVKLECCDVDMAQRKSLDSTSLRKEKEITSKDKTLRQNSKGKVKCINPDKPNKAEKKSSVSSDSDDDVTVASRLRVRKHIKTEDNKSASTSKSSPKTPSKKSENNTICPTARKSGFGDGSDFHPGWEEELYRYKRSLRMPPRLIAIPRGRSDGPFARSTGAKFSRGSTSLPDLDPAPLSPAPSLTPSAATDDLYTRRQGKAVIDSDLDSNSSSSAMYKLHYDSEASTSTVFSSKLKKKGSSIVDLLMQKCKSKREENKRKSKEPSKDDATSKNKKMESAAASLEKNENKDSNNKIGNDSISKIKKEPNSTLCNSDLIKTSGKKNNALFKSKLEDRLQKQKSTTKAVNREERVSSGTGEEDETNTRVISNNKNYADKNKLKAKSIKDKMLRRSSSIRDGLRSTISLKRNDAKGRLLRLKKRNNLIKSLANKRIKDFASNKAKKEITCPEERDKDDISLPTQVPNKKKMKRLFGRRKFSSGFDYIKKKKKIIRREDGLIKKIRRPAAKPSPESVNDIQKEIKSWFINKSVGETPLHRAARLGYTDCVAYCLEKMDMEPTSKDNAGFTPLHVAASKGHVRIGRLLLQYGANVSAAAQGGIRPLHEAAENNHVEMIRLLLSYGADPVLGTYAGQTPEELAEGEAATLLRLHIADVSGHAVQPWIFPSRTRDIDLDELGNDPLASPPSGTPPPPIDATIEIQCSEAPLPPFYSLRPAPGQPAEGLWCLLQDVTTVLQIKSKESLLKQIHCGSGSPKELLREIRTQEFLERAQCHQLMCAGEKVNVRASKVSLVRVTDKLRQLLKVETVLIS